MIREVGLGSYLPPFMQSYKEPVAALEAENPEFQIIWKATDKVLRNRFISTADEYGISRFEKMLGIYPSEEDTLESRRSRIQSKWFTTIPYTMKMLLSKLVALCGENNFTVTKQFSVYQIYIETDLEMFGQIDELERVLQAILPCNIVINTLNKIPCFIVGKVFAAGGLCSVAQITVIEGEDG